MRCALRVVGCLAAFGCVGKAADTHADSEGDSSPDTDSGADTDSNTHSDSDTGADSDTDTSWPYVEPAYTTTFGQEMMMIPAGTFLMGWDGSDPGEDYHHEVTLTHDFTISRAEITQAQWAAVIDYSPSMGEACDDCPMDGAYWKDQAIYCNALSEAEGFDLCYLADGTDIAAAYVDAEHQPHPYDCPGYRMPTEAEWEYAARADEDTVYSGSDVPEDVAWHDANSEDHSHPVCTLAMNAWGLCDMSGNVNEWVNDRLCPDCAGYGDGAPVMDPAGDGAGHSRVLRGGSWVGGEHEIRLGYRWDHSYEAPFPHVGFRLARTANP